MSKALVWKQDPADGDKGYRVKFLPDRIEDGPKDEFIEIVGLPKVFGDSNGNFLFSPQDRPLEFDAVHTYCAVRQVVNLFKRALRRLGNAYRYKEFEWQWGKTQPIRINPRAGSDENAFYSRRDRIIKFYYFQDKKTGETFYTNRSMDIVAHECAHAVLDSLCPGYWDSWHPQTGALHEAFADITSILTMLSQLDMCEAFITHSKANLHDKEFFSAFAEHFGPVTRARKGLRNADNKLTLAQVSNQVHDLSQVFTGAFYDVMVDIFVSKRNPDQHEDAQVLYRVGEHMTSLLVAAVLKGPPKNATYADIANCMMDIETNRTWKKVIYHHFCVRGVLGERRVEPIKKPVTIKWRSCKCTMAGREHTEAVEAAIRQRRTFLPLNLKNSKEGDSSKGIPIKRPEQPDSPSRNSKSQTSSNVLLPKPKHTDKSLEESNSKSRTSSKMSKMSPPKPRHPKMAAKEANSQSRTSSKRSPQKPIIRDASKSPRKSSPPKRKKPNLTVIT